MTIVSVLYIGPLKVDQIFLVKQGWMFNLYDKVSEQHLGIPYRSRGYAYLEYNLNHLSPMLQAQIRSRKNWTSMLIWSNGETWEGKVHYDHEHNNLCTLFRA